MPERKKPYDDPSNWEYDCGPVEFHGEVASPYINEIFDEITKKAFPEGKNAYQKQRAVKLDFMPDSCNNKEESSRVEIFRFPPGARTPPCMTDG